MPDCSIGAWSVGNDFGVHQTNLSESLVDTGVFERAVRRMLYLDALIHGEIPVGDRAVPYFMVAFSLPDERTAVRLQKFDNVTIIPRHTGSRIRGPKRAIEYWTNSGALPLKL